MNTQLLAVSIFVIMFLGIIVPRYSFGSDDASPQLCVSGIVFDKKAVAFVNGIFVREGDTIEGAKVIRIEKSQVTFEYKGKTFIKKFREDSKQKKDSVDKKEVDNEALSPKKTPDTESSHKEKDKEFRRTYAQNFYRKAKESYEKAKKEYGRADTTKAFIYYEMALKYTQEAYAFTDEAQRPELNTMIEACRERLRELKWEKNNIDNLKYYKLKTPPEIAAWIKKHIKYKGDEAVHESRDYWQSPKETIILESGDCEDFAFLAQALLNEINISSRVIMISFPCQGKERAHAICVFPDYAPYSCFDGGTLLTLNKVSVQETIDELYPGWTAIYELDFATHSLTLIEKRPVKCEPQDNAAKPEYLTE